MMDLRRAILSGGAAGAQPGQRQVLCIDMESGPASNRLPQRRHDVGIELQLAAA
jgi:hypothetical protein